MKKHRRLDIADAAANAQIPRPRHAGSGPTGPDAGPVSASAARERAHIRRLEASQARLQDEVRELKQMVQDYVFSNSKLERIFST